MGLQQQRQFRIEGILVQLLKGFVAACKGQFGPLRQWRADLGKHRPGTEAVVPVPIAGEEGIVEGIGLVIIVKAGLITPVLEPQGKSQRTVGQVDGIPRQHQVENDLLDFGIRDVSSLRPAQQFGRVPVFARSLSHAEPGIGRPGGRVCAVPALAGNRVVHAGLKAVVIVTVTCAQVA